MCVCVCVCVYVQVLLEEGLVDNAAALEKVMWRELKGLDPNVALTVRGRGLFFAIIIKPEKGESQEHSSQVYTSTYLPPPFLSLSLTLAGHTAWDVCVKLRDRGVLAKPTHDDIIRLAPPLTVTEEQLVEVCGIFRDVINKK